MKFELEKYFETSTIHGFQYLSKKYHVVEIIFWILSLISSLIVTLYLVSELIHKIQTVPIITYQSDETVSISEINFPAITLCTEFIQVDLFTRRNGTGRDNYGYIDIDSNDMIFYEEEEYSDALADQKKFKPWVLSQILDVIKIGRVNPNDAGINLLKRLQILDLLAKRGVFAMKNFSIPTRDFLRVMHTFQRHLKTRYSTTNLQWMFDKNLFLSDIITEFGICYSFNNALYTEILYDDVVSKDFHYHTYRHSSANENFTEIIPRRATQESNEFSINSLVDESIFTVGVCSNHIGYTIFLQDPYELPSKFSQQTIMSVNQRLKFSLEPQIHAIDDSLFDDDPIDRNCYLDDEKELKFFRFYTKANCEQECLTEFMINQCGCVEFFMIRNVTTRICSASEKSCYDAAKNDFEDYRSSCQCLQPCFYVKYNFQSERIIINKNFMSNSWGMVDLHFKAKFSSGMYRKIIKRKQLNEADILSFFGGLFGLFAGFSFLSFAELIYWFLIRIFTVRFNKITAIVHPMNSTDIVDERKLTLMNILREYFNESSIHGLIFFIKSNYIDKFLWLFIITFSLYIERNVIVSFDDHLNFYDQVDFPAVMFVPHNFMDYKFSKLSIDEAAKKFQFKDTSYCSQNSDFFNDLSEIYPDLNVLYSIFKNSSKVEFFKMQLASWNDFYLPRFAEVLTPRSMGFSFNLANNVLNFKRLASKFKYVTNITLKNRNQLRRINSTSYPLKVKKNEQGKLTFKFDKLEFMPDDSIQCYSHGFIIHSPYEIPLSRHIDDINDLKKGMTVNVEVTPEIIRTDEDLKSIQPHDRECYFKGEKKLKYFKIYTQNNCRFDCITRSSKKHCSHLNDTAKLKDCREKLMRNYLNDAECSCLPLCNSVNYHMMYTTEHDSSYEMAVNVKMRTDDVILYRRYQQFTISDAISYVGGLLGLFAGISMLSIVEFFYFFIFRLCVNLWRFFKR